MSASIDASSACAAARCVPVPVLSKEGGAMNANAIGGARVGAAPWKDCSHVHAARPSKSRHASAASDCCPCAARSACPNAACSAARSAARPCSSSLTLVASGLLARQAAHFAPLALRCSATPLHPVGHGHVRGRRRLLHDGRKLLVGWQCGVAVGWHAK